MAATKAQLDAANKLIDALRKQIQETKDALSQDDATLARTKEQVERLDIDLNKPSSGRVKLGAAGGGRLSLPSPEGEKVVEDKRMYTGTVMGIAELRGKLAVRSGRGGGRESETIV